MAIDALNDRTLGGLKESVATATVVANKTSKSAVKEANTSAKTEDAVMLTDSAMNLAKASQTAKNSSGIDEAKVEKLKAAINDGSYKIDYESVANKLIDSEDELSSIF